MNEPSSVNLRNIVTFAVSRERFGVLSFPNRSECKERKNCMIRGHTFSTPQHEAVAFIDRQPPTEFRVRSPDRVTLLQLAAQQNERKRIAQELHDTLLQGFTCVALKLDALTNTLPPALSKTKARLQKILEQTDEYLAEARRSIWQLRSSILESAEDLPSALVKASERALQGSAIPLSFSVRGAERKIQSVLEDNLLRICEEAVSNAVKHARPGQVEVTLEFNAENVQLRVRDDGCGFDPALLEAAEGGHFGLLGITERVEALSGTLSIESAPARGTSLLVTLPTDRTQHGNTWRESIMILGGTHCLLAKAS